MSGATVAQDRNKAAMGIKPIETRAYGHRFRSRLEARWAVAFTEARIAWQYEPEGFDLGKAGFYLPDFWLPQVSMWAEVKPDRPTDDELRKAAALANESGRPCLLLIGLPAAHAYWGIVPITWLTRHWLFQDQEPCLWQMKNMPKPDAELSDGTQVFADDYCPFEGSDYHLDEGRFYSRPAVSGTFPMPFDPGFGSHPAVEAALSARFEHGESPR